MTFDQWIDAVNVLVHEELGQAARTEELSWDSAMWVGRGGTVVAALQEDEKTAKLSFDGGESLALNVNERAPDVAARAIVTRLISPTA